MLVCAHTFAVTQNDVYLYKTKTILPIPIYGCHSSGSDPWLAHVHAMSYFVVQKGNATWALNGHWTLKTTFTKHA